MHRWLAALILLAASVVALAEPPLAPVGSDELAAMNAVSKAWDRYALLSSRSDPAAADVMAASSFRHFGFLRDAALVASSEQMRRIPLGDRAIVYALRATQTEAQLRAATGADMAKLCLRSGWCGIAEPDEGDALPSLSHVTVLGSEHAIGELAPPTGTQFQFGPEFVREGDAWKVMTESLSNDTAVEVQRQIQQSGLSETEMMEHLLAGFLDDAREPPALVTLDIPLRDDPDLRTQLNDQWPDYDATYKTRVQAIEKKAADGDSLAQAAMGALLYFGKAPDLVARDKARGLQLLEQASNAGNATAAAVVVADLVEGEDLPRDRPIPPERLERALPHLRRSANDGLAAAMSLLGDFYFNGAGGLARDCRQAEEWYARAEDGGHANARNARVWALAVCAIPEQRDSQRALQLAQHMIANADELSAAKLDTVAAALAANGRFEEAVDFERRALGKLPKDASPTMRRDLQERLRLYGKRQGWVQTYNAFEHFP